MKERAFDKLSTDLLKMKVMKMNMRKVMSLMMLKTSV